MVCKDGHLPKFIFDAWCCCLERKIRHTDILILNRSFCYPRIVLTYVNDLMMMMKLILSHSHCQHGEGSNNTSGLDAAALPSWLQWRSRISLQWEYLHIKEFSLIVLNKLHFVCFKTSSWQNKHNVPANRKCLLTLCPKHLKISKMWCLEQLR